MILICIPMFLGMGNTAESSKMLYKALERMLVPSDLQKIFLISTFDDFIAFCVPKIIGIDIEIIYLGLEIRNTIELGSDSDLSIPI